MINKNTSSSDKKFQSWMDFVSDFFGLLQFFISLIRNLRLTTSSACEGCHSRLERLRLSSSLKVTCHMKKFCFTPDVGY